MSVEHRTDRDLLISIDAGLKHLLEKMVDHEKEDDERFNKIEKSNDAFDKRLLFMERVCYGVLGCIVLVEFFIRVSPSLPKVITP